MERATVEIINKLGLHARAAAKLVKTASRFSAEVNLERNNQTVSAKSIMGVMMLAASKGSTLSISADGSDESEALQSVIALINDRFGEEE